MIAQNLDVPGDAAATAVPFSVTCTKAGNGVRVIVTGELDIFTAPALHNRLASLYGAWTVVDLTEVTFIDSSGLHVLIEAFEAVGGRLSIIPGPTTARVVEIAGLDGKLPLV